MPNTLYFSNSVLMFLCVCTKGYCCTFKPQPMDQSIIQTLKWKFKKKELKFVLNQIIKSEKSVSEILKEISDLNAIYWFDPAWQEVEGLTIQNMFARCGFD